MNPVRKKYNEVKSGLLHILNNELAARPALRQEDGITANALVVAAREIALRAFQRLLGNSPAMLSGDHFNVFSATMSARARDAGLRWDPYAYAFLVAISSELEAARGLIQKAERYSR